MNTPSTLSTGGASLEPYDKASLTRQLQELELTLAHSRLTQLFDPGGGFEKYSQPLTVPTGAHCLRIG